MSDAATRIGIGTGTRDDPWRLKTAPGTSEYEMYRDDAADPPQLVCQVGSTKLAYHARAIDDLHAWLREQGDWVPLGAADEQKVAAGGTASPLDALPTLAPGACSEPVPAYLAISAGKRSPSAQT